MTTDEYTTYVLHLRPYTDSRVLVDLFDRNFGRFTALARVDKKRSKSQFLPFIGIAVELSGRHDLKTITSVDISVEKQFKLKGQLAFCGMYINELVAKLIQSGEPYETLFDEYEHCLAGLQTVNQLAQSEPYLRNFEFSLISELGYGVDFGHSATGLPIEDNQTYYYENEVGWLLLSSDTDNSKLSTNILVKGSVIKALNERRYDSAEVKNKAKLINRNIIHMLLNGRELKSRELFL